MIDLLARLGTAFAFEDLEAQTVTVEGVPVRVATPATLHRMKKDTIRFRTIEEANAEREQREIERVQALLAERRQRAE